MKLSKKILALLLAGAMAASAAACAGSEPAASTAGGAAASAPAASAPADGGEAAASEAAPADDWAAKVGTKTFPAIAKEDLKIGFLYVGPVGDEGYSYAHDQGRAKMAETLGLAEDQTLIVENVPEESECADQVRNLIDQGCNVIFATSFGHQDWVMEVAKEYPDVIFEHCSGFRYGENMTAYFGRMYQIRYLTGIAAGLKTESNKIGYVAAMPTAEVVRGANAFALGVKSVNPDATVEVKFTNSWYDPAGEKNVAIDLLNSGCDVIGQHVDTTAPQVAAQEKGAFATGYNAATYDVAPQAYMTAPLWDWGSYYTAEVQKIIDGTWTSQNYWGDMKDGIVYLDELSANCAEGTQEKIDEAYAKIESGELKIFAGPISDNTGAERVPAGSEMTDAELLAFDWFVDNIVGTVPAA